MLIVNIDVAEGLVNVARGQVVSIDTIGGMVDVILVRVDNERVEQRDACISQYRQQHPRPVATVRHDDEATLDVDRGRGHVQVTRRQYPLTL